MADLEIYIDPSEFKKFEAALKPQFRYCRSEDSGRSLIFISNIFQCSEAVVFVMRKETNG